MYHLSHHFCALNIFFINFFQQPNQPGMHVSNYPNQNQGGAMYPGPMQPGPGPGQGPGPGAQWGYGQQHPPQQPPNSYYSQQLPPQGMSPFIQINHSPKDGYDFL